VCSYHEVGAARDRVLGDLCGPSAAGTPEPGAVLAAETLGGLPARSGAPGLTSRIAPGARTVPPPEFTGRNALDSCLDDGGDARVGSAPSGFGKPLGSLVARPPLVVQPLDPVADVARAMRAAHTGAALVASRSPGIVTDRDLRNRVVAEKLAPETPVHEVMSHPLKMLGADAPIHEALLLMLDQDIHHVPVTRDGRIVGMVTDKHLLRREARGPLLLMERIKSLARLEALEGYSLEVAATAESMLAEDVEPVRVARVIASLNDTLTGKLLRLAEDNLGPPPCRYAWLALGSEGRMEQVLATDQDNALAYADDTADAGAYFGALAERVVGGLVHAGFPPCPGGYMATRWHRPLAAWEQTFRQWVTRPEPQAVLEAEVFLDVRRAHGELSVATLERTLRESAREPLFLVQVARAALRFRPPLGVFGRVRADEGEIDVKRGGLAAIVLIGRLAGLAARSPARSTLERLRDGAAARALGADTAEALADSFRFLTGVRLRQQLRTLAAGGEPGNAVSLASLSDLERRRLREALRAVADAQRAVATRYLAGHQ
jgi:CBS domain-containing protein